MSFKPHPDQWEIYKSFHDHSFTTAACGRRFGKTELAWNLLLEDGMTNPGELYWWVAPIYKELIPISQTIRATTPYKLLAACKTYEQKNRFEYIRLPNGTEYYFHNAHTEDSLRGSGLKGLVLDEAGSMKRSRVEEELLPSLMDKGGWLLAIGTPKGRNWFYEYYLRGQDPLAYPDYRSYNFTSYSNTVEQGGYILKKNIDMIANGLPELTRRQEIMAEFLEGEGIVFRNIHGCMGGSTGPAEEGRTYTLGGDLGKTQDFTVLTAVDDRGLVRGWERFNQLDWTFQKKRIKSFCQRYPGMMYLDSTGLGDPIYDDLQRDGVLVQSYKFTTESKRNLVEKLSILLDQGQLIIPQDLRILQDELQAFSYTVLPSGNIRYEAPEGLHDDAVMSLALAVIKRATGQIQARSGWRGKRIRGRRTI